MSILIVVLAYILPPFYMEIAQERLGKLLLAT